MDGDKENGMDATELAVEIIKNVEAVHARGLTTTRADVFKSVRQPQPLVTAVIEELGRRGVLELGPDGRVAVAR